MDARKLALVVISALVGAALTVVYLRRQALFTLPLEAPQKEVAPRQDAWWQDLHKKYVAEFKEADEGEGFGVVFYGDSITEGWRGTDHGFPIQRAHGVPEIFNETFSSMRGAAFGIGSDQTAHLLWRIRHGELPQKKHPHAVVLNIGTNDLTAARWGTTPVTEHEAIQDAIPGIRERVWAIIKQLRHKLPNTYIVIYSMLPRGGDGDTMFEQPSVYSSAIETLNVAFRNFADETYIVYHDCAHDFLDVDENIRPHLLNDGVHPSVDGYYRLSVCLDVILRRLPRDDDALRRAAEQAAAARAAAAEADADATVAAAAAAF